MVSFLLGVPNDRRTMIFNQLVVVLVTQGDSSESKSPGFGTLKKKPVTDNPVYQDLADSTSDGENGKNERFLY